MDILLSFIVGVGGMLGFYFAFILTLLVIVNYAGFLVRQKNSPSVFVNSFKYVFLKNQDETISLAKVFKVSVWLTIATLMVAVGVAVFKG
jgi:hypothetical protein